MYRVQSSGGGVSGISRTPSGNVISEACFLSWCVTERFVISCGGVSREFTRPRSACGTRTSGFIPLDSSMRNSEFFGFPIGVWCQGFRIKYKEWSCGIAEPQRQVIGVARRPVIRRKLMASSCTRLRPNPGNAFPTIRGPLHGPQSIILMLCRAVEIDCSFIVDDAYPSLMYCDGIGVNKPS